MAPVGLVKTSGAGSGTGSGSGAGGGTFPGRGTGSLDWMDGAGAGGGAMPTMVVPAGAGGRGAPTMVGTGPATGGCPDMVVEVDCATLTEKTRSHCGHRTRRPPAGIFSWSTS